MFSQSGGGLFSGMTWIVRIAGSLNAVSLTLFAILSVRRWRHFRDQLRFYIALSITTLALMSVSGRIIVWSGYRFDLLSDVNIALFLVSGWAMFKIRASLSPVSRKGLRVRGLTATAIGAIGVSFHVTRNATTTSLPPMASVSLIAIVGIWAYFIISSVVVMWRMSVGRPVVQRSSLRALCMGFAGITAVFVLATVTGTHSPSNGRVLAYQGMAFLMIPVLYAGLLPPAWLRRTWRSRVEESIYSSVAELMLLEPDVQRLAKLSLESAVELVGADGGYLADDGGVIAEAGSIYDPTTPVLIAEGPGGYEVHRGASGFVLTLPIPLRAGRCKLRLFSGPMTPLLGGDEIAQVRRYTDLVASALDRAALIGELQSQTSRHAVLMQTISDLGEGLLVVTEGTKVVHANDAYLSLSGYSLEELMALDSVLDLATDEQRELLAERFRRRLAGLEVPDHYETNMRHKSGRIIDVEVAVRELEVNGSMSVVAVVRDITSRRWAERQLIERSEQLAEAQHLAGLGSFEWSPISETGSISHEMKSLLGLPHEFEESLPDLINLIHEDDRPKMVAAVEASAVDGSSFEVTVRVNPPQAPSLVMLVRGRSIIDADGRAVKLVATGQDVTERLEWERALQEANATMTALINASPVAIVSTDAAGLVRFWNAASVRLFGYSASDVIGRVDPLSAPQASSQATNLDAVRQRNDGSRVEVSVSTARLTDAHGVFIGRISLYTDITQRKRMEKALRDSERRFAQAYEKEREAVVRLRSVDEMKNAFLTAVSHELRTPLTSVIGFAQTLQDQAERLRPEQRGFIVDRLTVNAIKLQHLLADLLDVDRLQRGILEPHLKPANLAVLVGRVIESSEFARERAIRLTAEPIFVSVDTPMVERVVENLISNAVRYSSEGTIWVSVCRDSLGAVIEVADSGPGVPVELRSTIFEPFKQGYQQSHSPGVGIGLALVQKFTELHGGTVEVEEGVNGGAVFRVRLPIDETRSDGLEILSRQSDAAAEPISSNDSMASPE